MRLPPGRHAISQCCRTAVVQALTSGAGGEVAECFLLAPPGRKCRQGLLPSTIIRQTDDCYLRPTSGQLPSG
jgi:hypothetical protein